MIDLRPYAQLIRLPNLPTALADIALAGLAVGLPGRWPAFLLLLLASACLYSAGMALNDVFDLEEDKRDRPERPIPSGRIGLRTAARLGAALLIAGVALAFLAGRVLVWTDQGTSWLRPGSIALLLALLVLGYDAWLKHTPLGPAAMGGCRFLNVLMGVSIAGGLPTVGWHLAFVVGLYIAGVTLFAKTEARTSNKPTLAIAAGVVLAALVLALLLPANRIEADSLEQGRGPHLVTSPVFPYLLVVLGFALGFPIARAIQDPSSLRVQAAVKRCLICLILLDAVLATAVAGALGLVLLVLLGPSLYLNRQRWLYAT